MAPSPHSPSVGIACGGGNAPAVTGVSVGPGVDGGGGDPVVGVAVTVLAARAGLLWGAVGVAGSLGALWCGAVWLLSSKGVPLLIDL